MSEPENLALKRTLDGVLWVLTVTTWAMLTFVIVDSFLHPVTLQPCAQAEPQAEHPERGSQSWNQRGLQLHQVQDRGEQGAHQGAYLQRAQQDVFLWHDGNFRGWVASPTIAGGGAASSCAPKGSLSAATPPACALASAAAVGRLPESDAGFPAPHPLVGNSLLPAETRRRRREPCRFSISRRQGSPCDHGAGHLRVVLRQDDSLIRSDGAA